MANVDKSIVGIFYEVVNQLNNNIKSSENTDRINQDSNRVSILNQLIEYSVKVGYAEYDIIIDN